MAKNNSNSEKTIKNMLRAYPSDFWNIDAVSMYSNYLGIAIMPDGFILDDYRDHFENFLDVIPLEEKFHYSPSLFAETYYGTADLDFLVLYFANMNTLFDFNTPTIRVLPKSALLDLNKLIVAFKEEVKQSKNSPKEYVNIEAIKLPTKGYQ
jgi:hypothetical protein